MPAHGQKYDPWNQGRVRVLEDAARLEVLLDQSLALHLAQDPAHFQSLVSEVFSRIPAPTKITLLHEALVRRDLTNEVRFLAPRLRWIMGLRHVVAHSAGRVAASDDAITLWSHRKGEFQETVLRASELREASLAAAWCHRDFQQIEGRIGDLEVCGMLNGFNDRSV